MMRVASLLFVLSLLAWAATAYAECAWVLWRSFITVIDAKPHTMHWQEDVYDTRVDCVSLLDRMERNTKEPQTSERQSATRRLIRVPGGGDPRTPSDKGPNTLWDCMPETMHPKNMIQIE
jgi:hypothetical protein